MEKPKKCSSCGKIYQPEWLDIFYKTGQTKCKKCIVKEYCPHIDMDKYDIWIKEARELLIEAKNRSDKFSEDYFRNLLRNNISFKNKSLKEHLKFCLGY